MLPADVIGELRVEPGDPARLDLRPTDGTRAAWPGSGGHPTSPKRAQKRMKKQAKRDLDTFKSELESAQGRLYASDTWSVLLVFQGVDAAGKDSTIRHVLSGTNPQGVDVVSFKQPSTEELAHDFLWRCSKALPDRGRIGVFNRSHYEEVLSVRVHGRLLEAQRLPTATAEGDDLWLERYEDINVFERHLVRSGTRIIKFYLHLSSEEQRRRLLARLDDPRKQWKFSPDDLRERDYFDDYRHAYEEALAATSTRWAPWYVIPADRKPAMRALVAGITVHAIGTLDIRYPDLDSEQAARIDSARAILEAQGAAGA